MKKVFFIAVLTLLLSGCSWFQKGLDVCQDDSCFVGLAEEAFTRNDRDAARQFCDAIVDEQIRRACIDTLNE